MRTLGSRWGHALPWSAVPVALLELRTDALACTKCKLAQAGRSQVVFGVGDPAADLLFDPFAAF